MIGFVIFGIFAVINAICANNAVDRKDYGSALFYSLCVLIFCSGIIKGIK